MGQSGVNYLYNNPLTCKGGVTRKAWYSVPCCPSNLSRTWADLGKYIYSTEKDAIWIHQYIGSKATLQKNGQVQIEIESGLPWDGKIRIHIKPAISTEFTLHLRIPSWVSNFTEFARIKINSVPLPPLADPQLHLPHPAEPTAQGYDPCQSRFLSLQRLWTPGDVLELDFDMPITLRRTHPKVRGHHNKVAVTRGPLVYCLESTDNPGVEVISTRPRCNQPGIRTCSAPAWWHYHPAWTNSGRSAVDIYSVPSVG